MGIKIIQPGLFSTIQDLGRTGFQHLGISSAGAIDQYSYLIGQTLIQQDGPAIEFTIIGPKIEFSSENSFVLTGAIFAAKLNGTAVNQNVVVQANKGDILEIGPVQQGARGYIFFGQPLDIPIVANSYATHTRTQMGGFYGRTLKKNDSIPVVTNQSYKQQLGKTIEFNAVPEDNIVHIIKGPQYDAFSAECHEQLTAQVYEISDSSDRMGIRLKGTPIPPIESADIISEPVALGSIQVPNDGHPIILLHDRQTVGGYTKIASVSQADIHKLAQFKPGEEILFKWITIEQAIKNLKHFEQVFSSTINEIESTPKFELKHLRPTSKKTAQLIREEQ
ncbi:biotin-dependent carboxyltransferase family protein [Staphylococcus lugdunensis]|uniref:5-oxoprolinase subunit C family protein n=1 Tax=Staphylococcus TaxID=1279 RepID=UPI0008A2BC34|nr:MULTISPECIES: biotin-dependent carboxyltransferase family protein [Staphylococcus]ARJ13867.1 allophanate hydrolase [Staphylococcus lugdunensis]MCH8666781.1 biotin-dependent carboxyltransferase family protein [Staphylococcus lugdunensis]OFJ60908.1 allophanate hydrolase [Staphylococcus sp. HMSC077E11]OFM47063.1 allophanate hydrolase [Staphylococcus sp. HMSC077E12]OFR87413.1 allophanate hydrolase [Staphylococcus sp. HMSC059F04]